MPLIRFSRPSISTLVGILSGKKRDGIRPFTNSTELPDASNLLFSVAVVCSNVLILLVWVVTESEAVCKLVFSVDNSLF